MEPNKIKIRLPDGRETFGTQVDFKVIKEDWNEYELRNGLILRIKPVVSEVYILEEKDPATGMPNVLVKSTNVISLRMRAKDGEK